MKLSQSIWQTYKEDPADAEIPSHKLMIRAGLIHKSGAGLYNLMPMGLRVVAKIENIIREELNKIGAQEVQMTVVTPGELWQKSGRWEKMGGEMLRFKDKANRDLCISPTNEEAVSDIFQAYVKSYKQLPTNLYQINTKFRDEIRPRFGVMRGREFIMKDAYTFHVDKACMDKSYEEMYKAYEAIMNRIGFEFAAVEADAGAMGSSDSQTHEFQALANNGEDQLVVAGDYAANIEKAKTKRKDLDFAKTSDAVKEVETPNMATIEDVCNFLKKPQHQSLKALVFNGVTGEKVTHKVLMFTLGDDSLNELKLKNYLAVDHVTPMTDNEMESAGLVKGFIGPVGLNLKDWTLLMDEAVDLDAAYVAGANKVDYHHENVVPSRDAKDFKQIDLRLAKLGDVAENGQEIIIKRGIELGHIFQLGDKYTKSMGITVLDQNGKAMHPLMGCYGIGVTRIVAAAIEQGHDENGIKWPKSIAPYQVHLVHIGKKDEFKAKVEKMYEELVAAGIEVLYDDRNAGPGFKFKDADLLGLPFQLVMGERDYDKTGKLKINNRHTGDSMEVSESDVLGKLNELLS